MFTVVYFLFFLLMPWYTARDKTQAGSGKGQVVMTKLAFLARRRCGRRRRRRRLRAPPAAPTCAWSRAPPIRATTNRCSAARATFVNYCLNCHSAKYMRYNRLTDLGLTEQQIADNLILTATDKIGERR